MHCPVTCDIIHRRMSSCLYVCMYECMCAWVCVYQDFLNMCCNLSKLCVNSVLGLKLSELPWRRLKVSKSLARCTVRNQTPPQRIAPFVHLPLHTVVHVQIRKDILGVLCIFMYMWAVADNVLRSSAGSRWCRVVCWVSVSGPFYSSSGGSIQGSQAPSWSWWFGRRILCDCSCVRGSGWAL